MEFKKIMVTGGSGFIGSHLVDKLVSEGYEVYIYDIADPTYKNKYTYIKGDVLDLNFLKQSTRGMDVIFHLAAEANVNYYHEAPQSSTILNTIGTVNVLEAARENNIQRVLFASTEWVYQGSKELEVDEETQLYPNAPDHIYTSSKIASELYLINYQKLYGVNYTIIRFGIPFGERARPQTVTPIFISKALNNELITVDGDENNFRQFIYVKDLVDGCVKCLQPAGENQIFNINGNKKIKIIDIITNLEKIMDKKINYKIDKDRVGNYKGRLVKIDKAKKLLGWEPQTVYEEALASYHNWYLNNVVNN